MMLAEMNNKDLTILADLIQTGKVKPVIDRTYPLSQLPEALGYLEEGHARGKVVITVGDNIETLAPITKPGATSATTPGPVLIAFVLIGVPVGVLDCAKLSPRSSLIAASSSATQTSGLPVGLLF